jgi:hypothetical protein
VDELKKAAALAAADLVPNNTVVGHGLFIGMCSQSIVAKPPLDKPVIQVLEFARRS